MSTFKKGDKVYLFGLWSDSGTWYFEPFTVSSWGQKQGTLVRDDGSNFKRQVYPSRVNIGPRSWHIEHVADVADPRAKALELSIAYVDAERARKQACIEHYKDEKMYVRSMLKSLEALAPGVRD